MMTSVTTGTARRIGRIAAVGAVALLLAGSAAPAAEARWRDADAAMEECERAGGEAYYFEFMGVWAVGCEYVTVDIGSHSDWPDAP
jgi:hypothetical protein